MQDYLQRYFYMLLSPQGLGLQVTLAANVSTLGCMCLRVALLVAVTRAADGVEVCEQTDVPVVQVNERKTQQDFTVELNERLAVPISAS